MNQDSEPQSSSPKTETGPDRQRSPWLWAGLAVVVILVGGLGILISRSDFTLSRLSLSSKPIPGTALPTPTPTGTPTPTITPTITPTPPGSTPMAIESASGWSFAGVRVQPPHPDQGWLLVYGEAINESGESQRILGLQGTFYDVQGQPLALDDYEDYWPIETLPDGQRMPFELTLYGPTAVDQVELQISTEPGSASLRTGLEIVDLEGQRNEEEFCVAGQLRRPDPPLAEYAMVTAVLYDDDDRVINWGIGFEPADAFEGQESVSMFACAEHYNNVVARYELRAWGE